MTGVYTIKRPDGIKVAEGAILNGSTYVPVRAISEAAGIPLTVDTKEKVIVMGSETQTNEQMYVLQSKRNLILEDIKGAQGMVTLYETDVIPRAQWRIDGAINETEKNQYIEALNDRTKELEQYKADLAEAQKQLAEIEAQIAELQK
ncbi:hypothetical protein D3C74_394650 [compost metagenome]